MLAEADVASLLQNLESDRIESIISFREDKPGSAVCYLSNDFAGYKKPAIFYQAQKMMAQALT